MSNYEALVTANVKKYVLNFEESTKSSLNTAVASYLQVTLFEIDGAIFYTNLH